VACCLIFVMAQITGDFTLALKPFAWIMAVIMALAISFLGVFFYQKGARVVGSQNAAILSTFEPITSLVVGAAVYGEAVTAASLLGSLLILSSVVITAKMKE